MPSFFLWRRINRIGLCKLIHLQKQGVSGTGRIDNIPRKYGYNGWAVPD